MCWWIVVTAMILEIASSVSYYGPAWSYDDETNWPGNKCREGGKRQSPIDIRTTDVIKDFNSQFIKYGALKFIGYQKVLVSGVNNGHTIQFSCEGDETIHPVLTGGPLKHQYRLEQMHFHWLSEHSVNGMKYPMEIHFVHVRSDLTVMEALRKKDGLAIVAVFCQVQSDIDEFETENTEELAQTIPRLLNTGDRLSGVLLDMTKLFSPNKYNYFTYAGSLTSPECNEVVIWIIFESPIYMSDAQYRMFGKVGVGRHNFRSLQKVTNHLVFCPPASHINTPQIVIFFESVVKLVAEFFKNVTSYMAKGLKSR